MSKLTAMIGDGWMMTLERSPRADEADMPREQIQLEAERIADAFRIAGQVLCGTLPPARCLCQMDGEKRYTNRLCPVHGGGS